MNLKVKHFENFIFVLNFSAIGWDYIKNETIINLQTWFKQSSKFLYDKLHPLLPRKWNSEGLNWKSWMKLDLQSKNSNKLCKMIKKYDLGLINLEGRESICNIDSFKFSWES